MNFYKRANHAVFAFHGVSNFFESRIDDLLEKFFIRNYTLKRTRILEEIDPWPNYYLSYVDDIIERFFVVDKF